jgi:phosphoribosylaminoimidazolecarboxamide formyltransferase/IMP cyclohydrolase
MTIRKINTALISVFHKDNLESIVLRLHELEVEIYSTGGTQTFIEQLHVPVKSVESLTGYPSILGGRVKTLHPKIFGGILSRRENESDQNELSNYEIPAFDLILVDLYPFEETMAAGASHEEIIEKIDIGGISLIRAAAKNYQDTLIISSREQYKELLDILNLSKGETTPEQRKLFATRGFEVTSHYDTAIFNYFNREEGVRSFKQSLRESKALRYGENPHQQGIFYGSLNDTLEQLHGKELSYNNLVDIDSALNLLEEFENETVFIIIKHTNACGLATAASVAEAYQKALAGDPVSAFGGILATNKTLDESAASLINDLFFEILIAPAYSAKSLQILQSKKNRILLKQKSKITGSKQFRNLVNGVIEQDRDLKTDSVEDLKVVTKVHPNKEQIAGMLFASKIAKHTKSNTIVLAVDGQLLASGVGQTSRVDALQQAITKAGANKFDLKKAVMASDAFFPFPDCVEIAHNAGIIAVIQPGGSIKDQDSINFCNSHGMTMAFTGIRHFKH